MKQAKTWQHTLPCSSKTDKPNHLLLPTRANIIIYTLQQLPKYIRSMMNPGAAQKLHINKHRAATRITDTWAEQRICKSYNLPVAKSRNSWQALARTEKLRYQGKTSRYRQNLNSAPTGSCWRHIMQNTTEVRIHPRHLAWILMVTET